MHASTFAIKAHGDQKYGVLPYEAHLAEVVGILVKDFGVPHDSHLIAAGWLHDVAEDTTITVSKLREMFGSEISDVVSLVTDPDLPTRAERKAEFFKRMGSISIVHRDLVRIDALVVKTADRIANLRTGVREGNTRKLSMYMGEDKAFRSLFTHAFAQSVYGGVAVEMYNMAISHAKEKLG